VENPRGEGGVTRWPEDQGMQLATYIYEACEKFWPLLCCPKNYVAIFKVFVGFWPIVGH